MLCVQGHAVESAGRMDRLVEADFTWLIPYWECKVTVGKSLNFLLVESFFHSISHGSHIGVPKQRCSGHVGLPERSRSIQWNLFDVLFLFLHKFALLLAMWVKTLYTRRVIADGGAHLDNRTLENHSTFLQLRQASVWLVYFPDCFIQLKIAHHNFASFSCHHLLYIELKRPAHGPVNRWIL